MTGIIFATCFSGDGETYRRVARPFIERVAGPDDMVVAESGDGEGICAVYNRFLAQARDTTCAALVLIQDDVEIHDPDFRAKVIAGVGQKDAGIVGAIGARDVTALEWWNGTGVGQVFETRGPIVFTERSGPVDAVDGLLLALSPQAVDELAFDTERFPRFHGYDVDICFAARHRGLQVEVVPLRLLHRTKGGYKNTQDFEDAKAQFVMKYRPLFPQIPPPDSPGRLETFFGPHLYGVARSLARTIDPLRIRVRSMPKRAKRGLRRLRDGLRRRLQRRVSVTVDPACIPICLACGACPEPLGEGVSLPSLLDCGSCGSSITWPPPTIDAASDRIWRDQYGGVRLQGRHQWMREARIRLAWMVDIVHVPMSNEVRLFDIGAGTGEFVEVARTGGFDAVGIEPSTWAVSAARDLGVDIFEGELSTWLSGGGGRADLATLWHVLEHMPDPAALLRELRGALTPGGRVIIEVPNRQSSESQRLGSAWHGTQLGEHVTHFSPDGLRKLLELNGFSVDYLATWTEESYAHEKTWLRRTNAALLGGHAWPAYDLIRAVAVKVDRDEK